MTTVPLSSQSIPELVATRADVDRDALALLAPDHAPVTYGRLELQAAGVVARLREAGIARTDRVALLLPNGPELAAAFVGIASAAACAPLNPAYRRAELEFYLTDVAAKALVIASDLDSPARALVEERGLPVIEIASLDEPFGSRLAAEDRAAPSDVALVLHTSGTTSRPKLVPLTHANLCASAENVSSVLRLTADDRCLNVMPLFHIHGLVAGVLAPLWSGGSVICAPDFQAPSFLSWLEELSPTWYTAVPTVHQAVLARVPSGADAPVRSRLRLIRSSSAPLPPVVLEELERTFGVPVIESYGMTEAAHQMTSNPLPPGIRKPGSVGAAAGPEVAVLDDAGDVLEPGAVGEVAIRGDNVFAGYENNAAANESAFTNGWFRTGDQGSLDADGYLFLRGRLKEVINRGGEKISPREVDDVLLAHPAVAQAITFAVPDSRLGEDVGAAVVLREEASASERTLQEFAAERLAEFKVPRLVVFVDEIPKGPSGKLQRIGLAETLGISASEQPGAGFVEPRTQLERELAALWADALGVEQVGVTDTFFALGGDSILAAELVARLRETYDRPRLPLTTLVWAPTIEQLAHELTQDEERWRPQLVVPIVTAGEAPPLFFVHGLHGEAVSFGALAHRLGSEQPFYGIRARGVAGDERPHEGLEQMVSDYLAEVRAVQPGGPYYLGGLCMGAPIAVELARRLQAAGEDVAFLALVDPRVQAAKGWRYYLWQTRLAARKIRSGDYSWRLALPHRQREVWQALHGSLRRKVGLLDRREPAARAFEQRLWEIRSDLVPVTYRGDVSVYVSVDWPLREWFWKPLIDGDVEVQEIPSRHTPILRPPAVDILATRVGRALRAAQAAAGEAR